MTSTRSFVAMVLLGLFLGIFIIVLVDFVANPTKWPWSRFGKSAKAAKAAKRAKVAEAYGQEPVAPAQLSRDPHPRGGYSDKNLHRTLVALLRTRRWGAKPPRDAQ